MSDDISRNRWNHSSPGKYGHTTVAHAAGSSSSRCATFGRLSQSAFTQQRSPVHETENASTATALGSKNRLTYRGSTTPGGASLKYGLNTHWLGFRWRRSASRTPACAVGCGQTCARRYMRCFAGILYDIFRQESHNFRPFCGFLGGKRHYRSQGARPAGSPRHLLAFH